MSCYGEIEKIDAAVFADTGWESKRVYKWLKFLQEEGNKHGVPIQVVSQGNIKNDALNSRVRGVKKDGCRAASMPYFTLNREDGSSGMIRRQCTSDYKIRPLEKKFRELAGYKPRQRIPASFIEAWKGISTDEMRRATISKNRWIDFYYPLIDMGMSRDDCLLWFANKGLPAPPRSSCLGCPFHHNREWRLIRDESPDEWLEVVAFDKAIRKCGGLRGDVFIHADRVPLEEVDLRTAADAGQLSLWGTECAGICGV